MKIQHQASVDNGVTVKGLFFPCTTMVFPSVTNPRNFIERKSERKQEGPVQEELLGANDNTGVCGHTRGQN